MRIRTKLALILSGGIAAATIASGAAFLQIQSSQIRKSEIEKTRVLLQSIRQMASESRLSGDPLMLFDYLEFLRDGREEVHHCRVSSDGRWQDVGGKPMIEPPGGTTIETVELPTESGQPALAVEVHFLSTILAERQKKALSEGIENAARAGGVLIIGGLIISFLAARSMTGRLVAIEETVEAVAEGKLGQIAATAGSDEIASLARGVNAMSEKLREVEQLKKTFVASVTHELRSPLGAIEAQVKEMLRGSDPLAPATRANLERIRKNASRLEHFVTNLLEMSKIERGKLDYHPRKSEIGPLIEDAVLFFAPRAKEAGLTLESSVAGSLPNLNIDPDLISQVLVNFLSNAIKFTRKGGNITVSAIRVKNENGDQVECSVEDTGVGIPAESLAKVFAPFERVRNPLRATGAGLGLAISKSIIDMHGGTVGASSELNRGSRFFFRLPLEGTPAAFQGTAGAV